MLKKFTLKNYKNFKNDITIDFGKTAGYQFNTDCISNNTISKMLIYGRNATGKTNLGKALLDIVNIMFKKVNLIDDGVFLNADSKDEVATFCYIFQFNEHQLQYKYSRYANQELKEEELIIDKTNIFKCDFAEKTFCFDNLKYIDAKTANTKIYLESLENEGISEELIEPKLPFLRWLINNVAFKPTSILIQLSAYIRKMTMITVGSRMFHITSLINNSFYKYLEEPARLKDFEDFLNMLGIECKLVLKKLPDGQLELYFAHENLVPFYKNASSGTLALVDLYRRLIPQMSDASLIYLDEFDAFYHYEMAENVIQFFKKHYPKAQIIMTSHNTNLMTNRIMRPDCVFILSRTGTLTALCDATQRELREGHNLEKMYISGEFERYE